MFSNCKGGFLMKKFLLLFILMFMLPANVFAEECDFSTQCALMGKQYLEQKDYKNAIKYFDKAILLDSNDIFAYSYRAKTYYYLKNYTQAMNDIEKSLKIMPNSVAYGLKATLKLEEGDYKSAINLSTEALKFNPRYMKCYEVRARAKVYLGNYIGALKDIVIAIQYDEKYAKNYEVEAMALMGLKDYQLALEKYQKAAELFKKNRDKKNYRKMKRAIKECKRHIK